MSHLLSYQLSYARTHHNSRQLLHRHNLQRALPTTTYTPPITSSSTRLSTFVPLYDLGKLQKQIAEIYEKGDDNNDSARSVEDALAAYEQAEQFFNSDNRTQLANQCAEKVALLAAEQVLHGPIST